MEAGGTIDAAGSHPWSSIHRRGNGPQERLVFLPHAVWRSESNMDAFDDDARTHTYTHTHTLTPIRTHARTGPGARTNKKAGSLVNMQHRERAVLSCCVDLSLMISLNSTRNMMSFDRPVVTRL